MMYEVTKLKEEIQIKPFEKPQVKADEKAPDTSESQPRKDLVRDHAVTNRWKLVRRIKSQKSQSQSKKAN